MTTPFPPEGDALDAQWHRVNRASLIKTSLVMLATLYMVADLSLLVDVRPPGWQIALVCSLPFLIQVFRTRLSLGGDDTKPSPMRTLMDEVIAAHPQGERLNRYVIDTNGVAAHAINYWLLNNFRRFNAIYLSRGCLLHLSPDEVRATIAHELAHFFRYIFFADRARWVGVVFAGVLPYWAYVHHPIAPWIFWPLWPVLAFIGFALIVLLTSPGRDHSRLQEHLCDLHGARRYGRLNMVNALLKLHKAGEIESAILLEGLARIAADEQIPPDRVRKILVGLQEQLFAEPIQWANAKKFADDYFRSDAIAEMRRPLNARELAARTKLINKLRKATQKLHDTPKLINWIRFDFFNRDGAICRVEYPHLIKAIREQPEAQLVNFVGDRDHSADVHPSLRQRILYLHERVPEATQ